MRDTVRTLALLLALAGCAAPPPPPPPPAPPPPPLPEGAWTLRGGVELRADSGAPVVVPRPVVRLEVVGVDSLGLRVRCAVCGDTAVARVARGDVLVPPFARPDEAATGSLAEFALAVRDAAAIQDVYALRPVMAPDFSFALIGASGADEAIAAWRWEGFRSLRQVPALLDGGMVELREGLWVAPAEFQSRLDYRGLRLGFRRDAAGRWEWLFLQRGDG